MPFIKGFPFEIRLTKYHSVTQNSKSGKWELYYFGHEGERLDLYQTIITGKTQVLDLKRQ